MPVPSQEYNSCNSIRWLIMFVKHFLHCYNNYVFLVHFLISFFVRIMMYFVLLDFQKNDKKKYLCILMLPSFITKVKPIESPENSVPLRFGCFSFSWSLCLWAAAYTTVKYFKKINAYKNFKSNIWGHMIMYVFQNYVLQFSMHWPETLKH